MEQESKDTPQHEHDCQSWCSDGCYPSATCEARWSGAFITFTGVDDDTDPAGLVQLADDYPVEFGLLFSPKRQGIEPRYPKLTTIEWLDEELPLRWAAHLCGDDARAWLYEDRCEHDWLRLLPARADQHRRPEHPAQPDRQWAAKRNLRAILQCRGDFPRVASVGCAVRRQRRPGHRAQWLLAIGRQDDVLRLRGRLGRRTWRRPCASSGAGRAPLLDRHGERRARRARPLQPGEVPRRVRGGKPISTTVDAESSSASVGNHSRTFLPIWGSAQAGVTPWTEST
jgi:hypothetical protein